MSDRQELPECPRHPDETCPGECQYILPKDGCIHDKLPRRGRALFAAWRSNGSAKWQGIYPQ